MPTMKQEGAALFVPKDRTLAALRDAVQKCHGCDLYRHATQAVFGELETGTEAKQPRVAIMMIGEQTRGTAKTERGDPSSGRRGNFWTVCLEEAEIDRRKVYVTNTVKSRAQMASLPRNHPKEFYDVVVQVAIIRPDQLSAR